MDPMAALVEQCEARWRASGATLLEGVSSARITEFETSLQVKLPEVLAALLCLANGSDDMDAECFRFLPLEQYELMGVDHPLGTPLSETSFVFVDYLIWSCGYAVELGKSYNGAVYEIGTRDRKPRLVSETMEGFLELYLADDALLYDVFAKGHPADDVMSDFAGSEEEADRCPHCAGLIGSATTRCLHCGGWLGAQWEGQLLVVCEGAVLPPGRCIRCGNAVKSRPVLQELKGNAPMAFLITPFLALSPVPVPGADNGLHWSWTGTFQVCSSCESRRSLFKFVAGAMLFAGVAILPRHLARLPWEMNSKIIIGVSWMLFWAALYSRFEQIVRVSRVDGVFAWLKGVTPTLLDPPSSGDAV